MKVLAVVLALYTGTVAAQGSRVLMMANNSPTDREVVTDPSNVQLVWDWEQSDASKPVAQNFIVTVDHVEMVTVDASVSQVPLATLLSEPGDYGIIVSATATVDGVYHRGDSAPLYVTVPAAECPQCPGIDAPLIIELRGTVTPGQ